MSRRIPFGAPIATAAQMRAAEQAVMDGGVSVDELMERAGLAIAREVRRFAANRRILIAAGPGNNGGDAYVAARHLAAWGLQVAVSAHGRAGEGAAARMAARWTGRTVALDAADPRPLFVDGLFGTGTSRPLDTTTASLISRLQGAAELTIAIDLPSGIFADGTGVGNGVSADLTIALGALKIAHVVGPEAVRCGHVMLADIGVPVCTSVTTIAPPSLAPLTGEVQKFSRGMVAVVGGAMPGASLLAASAAMRGGAGYVMLTERQPSGVSPHALVRRTLPDADALASLLDDHRIGAVVIGPGLARDTEARALLDATLASRRDLIVDADALSLLGRDVGQRIGTARRTVFLTPHGGEFDRLFGADGGNKIDRTLAAAAASGAIVIHKGSDTVIATPDGQAVVMASATPWLSTAGTGDVLAGLVASRHAHLKDRPLQAASEAVWLHAAAAALATPPFIADDVVARLPDALAAATL
ncbi:NAD(P)H-hydrate dehydratase [Sphingomonas bacterium]|uniref:NAD(P)H-hydrate dehydratase n=1 Tax=Sphingomonas bacterium TaxID=1895847 RepID=UPI0020C7391D|nr:NAD(P)H-hydrate dehydratase [Sphingomonas bacterium]